MIHPTAVIDPSATLADTVSVGPYAIIGADVSIGAGSHIGAHTVIHGPTKIGQDNQIHSFCSIGDAPQDISFDPSQTTYLEIGDRNTFREYVSIHRGAAKDDYVTRVGSDNLLMAYVHVAHNCQLGNHIIMANSTDLSGHVIIDDYATISGGCGIHQFCRIGRNAMIGGLEKITQDVLPFVMYAKGKAIGINKVGLKRRGFDATSIQQIQRAYKLIYRANIHRDDLPDALRSLAQQGGESAIETLIEALQQSTRGLA
ncbi:MAG: acyl-ACP--UDP-N-acetylglucosamine O-acyltransferase [Pseudomonadales bacterium]|nr:acyl-ACP--UDP-N-acetylglucosamine O-acyltransferase [Pseudomonadales bacterium]